MSAAWLHDPAGPLLAFGAQMGIPAAAWQEREEATQLGYAVADLPRERALALTVETARALYATYGDALALRFFLDELPVFSLGPRSDQAALEHLRQETRLSPTVALDLQLNKARLVQDTFGSLPGHRILAYLFPPALARLLQGRLSRLEAVLWGEDPACRVVILVPGHDIRLAGPYLAVLGGPHAAGWQQAIQAYHADAETAQTMRRVRAENLRWDDVGLRFLTPLHTKLLGQSRADDEVAAALRVKQANMLVLYTADRTVAHPSDPWISTYEGAGQSVRVPLSHPAVPPPQGDATGVEELQRMVEWIYAPHWAADRLALAQVSVAQALAAEEEDRRQARLLRSAASIFSGLKWHWKAFVEGKVTAYDEEVRSLEDYVDKTVEAFNERISAMVRSLSETMLAAVAALLGSFIAALFRTPFNTPVFVAGMLVYAAYVLFFPLLYNMSNQWAWYRSLADGMAARRARFESLLYPDKVEEIVGKRVADSEARFRRWFRVTVAAYVAVIILALAAALVVPALFGP